MVKFAASAFKSITWKLYVYQSFSLLFCDDLHFYWVSYFLWRDGERVLFSSYDIRSYVPLSPLGVWQEAKQRLDSIFALSIPQPHLVSCKISQRLLFWDFFRFIDRENKKTKNKGQFYYQFLLLKFPFLQATHSFALVKEGESLCLTLVSFCDFPHFNCITWSLCLHICCRRRDEFQSKRMHF